MSVTFGPLQQSQYLDRLRRMSDLNPRWMNDLTPGDILFDRNYVLMGDCPTTYYLLVCVDRSDEYRSEWRTAKEEDDRRHWRAIRFPHDPHRGWCGGMMVVLWPEDIHKMEKVGSLPTADMMVGA